MHLRAHNFGMPKEYPVKTSRCSILHLACALIISLASHAAFAITYTYTEIKVPNAIATAAGGVNTVGDVVGWYNKSQGGPHGYLLKGGTFTFLDYPGASSTVAAGINDSEEIVGYFTDSSGMHGFSYISGQYTAIDYPGANGTFPAAVNASGQIVGYYVDSNIKSHGFLLSGGTYSGIDAPNASSTFADGINVNGDISGAFNDANGEHGFFLSNGAYRTINVPGATSSTGVSGVNDQDHMVGTYVDPGTQKVEGFLTNLSKFLKIKDPSGSTTFPYAINNHGVIVGIYFDSFGNEMAFRAIPH